ncbi:MAG: AAA family ATPase [Actinobacteria bacterium]|nr:AAA family ATPase [Actinomycetota bacterium]
MRICATCGSENLDSARFCARCGSALAPPCSRCGSEIPPGSRFCPTCGARVEEGPGPEEERRVVTVLFADVTGSTGLAERLGDPERLKSVMSSFFGAMREEIEKEGGTVEKFIGDAVMAAFGVPAAHEDDPTRALRAALRMRSRLAGLNEGFESRFGVSLEIRVGVNTGEVMASAVPRPGEGIIAGDAVNVAARLEQLAEPGQILAGERTVRSSWGLRFRPVGPLDLRGRSEAVTAFELLGPEGGETLPPAAPRPPSVAVEPPFVGRSAELELVGALVDRVHRERRPHVVTVYGEAGVGKTRLIDEFASGSAAKEPSPLVLRGRCLPYGEGITYWPLVEILRDRAKLHPGDPPEEARRRLERSVGSVLTSEVVDDPKRALDALAASLGLEEEGAAGAASPRRARADLVAAWRGYLSALAGEATLLVLVEDLHWAAPALLDLLEELFGSVEGPILFLCSARPDLAGVRPWGGGGWNVTAMLLEPLAPVEAEELLGHLGGGSLPGPIRRRILDRAGGNPFFLEEITRHVLEEAVPLEPERIRIPDTIQGVLASRVDLLAPAEKRALQLASVAGRTFWSGAVADLLTVLEEEEVGREEVETLLEGLEGRGLVVPRVGTTMAGEREYVFRHVLIRDVAYERLTHRERAAAHARLARWLEDRAEGRPHGLTEQLAFHCSEALEAEVDDPEEAERLRASAYRSALAASDETRGDLALDRALGWARRAVTLAAGDVDRARALRALGRAAFLDSQGDRAWEAMKEAALLLSPRADVDPGEIAEVVAEALEIVTRGRGAMRARLAEADVLPLLELGLDRAGEGDGVELARLLVVRSFWPTCFRDARSDDDAMEEARRAGEEAAEMAMRLARPDLASAALDGVGSYYMAKGMFGKLGEVLERRLALSRGLEDPVEAADALSMAAWAAFRVGRYRDALHHADEGLGRAAGGAPLQALDCLDWRALARFRLGDWEGFLADVRAWDELVGDRRDRPPGFASDHIAAAAFVHEVRGDAAAADRNLAILDWLEQVEERPSPAWAVWRALVEARRGDPALARSRLEDPRLVATVRYERGYLLEALTDVVAAQEAWGEAGDVVEEARAVAGTGDLLALGHFADRLAGRAALAGSDPARAAGLLEAAGAGFAGLGAEWEAAVTALDLADALAALGRRDAAREVLAGALPVLERVRSVREAGRARAGLASPA